MTDSSPEGEKLEKLEKQLATLRKKLERSTWHRADLENQHDRDQHLYQRVHAELAAARRNAEIEIALERVRARAMAMRKPEDLSGIAEIVFAELKALGFADLRNTEIIINHDTEASITSYYYSDYGVTGVIDVDYRTNPILAEWAREMQKADDAFAQVVINENEIQGWREFRQSLGYVRDPKLDTASSVYYYSYSTGLGALSISSFQEVSAEQLEVLARFRNVFTLAYQRYVDIARAEAQAREVQVELALERVRARAMAMRRSEELLDVIFTIHREYSGLGFPCGAFWQTRYTDESYHKALTGIGGKKLAAIMELPRDFAANPALSAWERGDERIGVFKFDVDAACEYHDHMVTKGRFLEVDPEAITQEMIRDHNGWTFVQARTTHGEIGYSLWGETDPTEEAKDVLVRFARTFDLAYTRFVDLQKAEERVREAQVQLALERIRTQSMRMQHSSELVATSVVFHEQLLALGIASEFSYVWLPDEPAGKHQFWATWAETGNAGPVHRSKAVTYDLDKSEAYTAACFAAWESEDPIHVDFISSADIGAFFATWGELLRGVDNLSAENFPDGIYYAEGYMRYGCFGINIRQEPTSFERDVLRRFALEFEQAYTRFLDLQRAEAQAWEANRQAALDRVRAEIASMRTTDDLERITPLIWRELIALDVPFFRCGVFIMDEAAEEIETYLTTPEGESLAAIRLPYAIAPTTEAVVESWKRNSVYTAAWDREQFVDWVRTISDRGILGESEKYSGGQQPPESLSMHFLPFRQGMLYVGSAAPLDDVSLDSARILADSFSGAYARYEDFQRLEEKNREVEAAMTDLRAAQARLVQSEKMASLGQLTAGIAHEIKNPLNFINNFASLLQELVDDFDEAPDDGERRAILEDVKANAATIEEHGRRADGIVRAMMEHARSGSGQRAVVDLNSLVEEYAGLAFHGMRARFPEFDARMKQDLAADAGEVELVPQEIGRVLINLLDNAFDAVRTYAESQSGDYSPTVTVSTSRDSRHAWIRIADNGPGMPDEVRSKVFEPFYTTKPTGQGTGLGLSLSHDIVAQGHGGSLEVETVEGEGATFVIGIPVSPAGS